MAKTLLHQRKEAAAARAAHHEAQVEATRAAESEKARLAEFVKLHPDEKARQTKAEGLRRRREHNAAQPDEPPVMEKGARLVAKAEARAAQEVETKAAPGPPENKATTGDDLENKSKDELRAMAETRVLTVERSDGRTDLDPLKDDYIRALRAAGG